MPKATVHARKSAARFGGVPADYVAVHEWFDQSKMVHPTVKHRAILHNSFGIYLCAQVFGRTFARLSDGAEVDIRDIGEQHVLDDLGCIPTLDDYLNAMPDRPWMGGNGLPPSAAALTRHRAGGRAAPQCPTCKGPWVSRLEDQAWEHDGGTFKVSVVAKAVPVLGCLTPGCNRDGAVGADGDRVKTAATVAALVDRIARLDAARNPHEDVVLAALHAWNARLSDPPAKSAG